MHASSEDYSDKFSGFFGYNVHVNLPGTALGSVHAGTARFVHTTLQKVHRGALMPAG